MDPIEEQMFQSGVSSKKTTLVYILNMSKFLFVGFKADFLQLKIGYQNIFNRIINKIKQKPKTFSFIFISSFPGRKQS